MDETHQVVSPPRKRRRAKVACEPCRERKRKCDGQKPCATCVQLEYHCSYKDPTRAASAGVLNNTTLATAPATTPTQLAGGGGKRQQSLGAAGVDVRHHVQLLEANSGAAFVRNLGLHIDPSNAPRLHLFAWNTGERLARCLPGTLRSVTSMLTKPEMTRLALVYFDQVAPTYGCIDRDSFFKQLDSRWQAPWSNTTYDPVFCGVAALGLHFSERFPMAFEPDLVETAKTLLEQDSLVAPPSVDTVTGWVLRVAYLRMTSTPHATWLASCSLIHVAEAANIHIEAPLLTVFDSNPSETIDLDTQRRLWGLAQHFNIWASYDLGRSRITVSSASTTTKPVEPTVTDYTSQILALVPISEKLDPNKPLSVEDLETDLLQVLAETRNAPSVVMARVNLMLCIFRRLRAGGSHILHAHMDRIISVALKGLHASQAMIASYSPWHHAANIPFQVVCLLLAIDSQASLTHLGDAMDTLQRVRDTWDSPTMREAYSTAVLLIYLHQQRKENDARNLRNVLERYSTSAQYMPADPVTVNPETVGEATTQTQQGWTAASAAEVSWLGSLVSDMPALREIDVEQFLMQPA